MSYKTYTLGNNSVILWRQSIDTYYAKKGGLVAFTDATTVRTMLRMTHDYLEKDEAMIKGVLEASGAEASEEFAAAFADERVAMEGIRTELENWLSSKNLTL